MLSDLLYRPDFQVIERMILDKFRNTIESFGILQPEDKVIVGVSGGSDSVGLLYMLLALEDLSLKLVVAHVNHKLRGNESDRDAGFVRELAGKLNLDFEYVEVDTDSYRKVNKLSPEDAARKLRYDFFYKLLEKHKASKIATAHTLDDQAETVIMRLLRGSGTLGLSAIKPESNNLVRPLLNIKKSDIRVYLESRGIKWIEDSSNNSDDFRRNRIRNELIPVIENIQPNASEIIARSARVAAIESDFINEEVKKTYKTIISSSPIGLIGKVDKYLNLHDAIRFGVLRMAISDMKGDINAVTSEHLFSVNKLIESENPSGQIDLPENTVFSKGYELFCISRQNILARQYSLFINEPGSWKLSEDITVEIEITSDVSLWGKRDVGYFSLKRAGFPITIRSYQDGDRFFPLGMENSKKVKDFFIDEKVPRFLRNKVPLFESGGEIMWLGGMRIDDRFKADEDEESFLRIKISGVVDRIFLF